METFDPQSESRGAGWRQGRLRRDLERYYLSEGRSDPIRIEIPKGAYAPTFEATEVATETAKAADDHQPAEVRPDLPRPGLSRYAIASFAIVALLASGLGVWWFAVRSTPNGSALGVPSLAVVNFGNLSGDPKQDYIAVGVTAELIRGLLKFDHLVVVSRAGSSAFAGQDVDARKVGSALSVDYVLMGNVQKLPNNLRVGVELLDAETSTVLWSGGYDRSLTSSSIADVRKLIADNVARKLAEPYGVIHRNQDEALNQSSSAAAHFSAYNCVLRLYSYWTTRTAQEHARVRSCLEDAVERNPTYAEAWSGLAFIYLDEVRDGYNPRRDVYDPLDKALEAARRAVRLSPDSASAHRALYTAHFIRNEMPEFLVAVDTVLSLDANNVDVLGDAGFKLTISGQWTKGIALLDQAASKSPVHPRWWHFAYCPK